MRFFAVLLWASLVAACEPAQGSRALAAWADAASASAPALPSASAPAAAASASSGITAPASAPTAPAASRYTALAPGACLAELNRRGIAHTPAPEARADVATPVRLAGPLGKVAVVGIGLATKGDSSPYGIADCRLLLALDDLARLLAARGIVELQHMSMYRPGAKKPGRKVSQHQRGLAIDLGALVRAGGERLAVVEQWRGRLGDAPCPPPPLTGDAQLVRELPCTLHEQRLFHVIVTPNANPQHHDHLHLDLTEAADWFVID